MKRELIPASRGPSQPTFPPSSSEEEEPSNLVDTIFWFLDENYPASRSLFSDGSSSNGEELGAADCFLENQEDGEGNPVSSEAIKAFWEEQEQLLQATLYRTTSTESEIRHATKEALRQSKLSSPESFTAICCCQAGSAVATCGGCCRSCLRREVFEHLRDAGYNCSIRKSKWKSSAEIPSGEHTYLEVVEKPSSKKGAGGEMRVIIELNFRAEFEMARASKEYNRLVARLPEVFVGKQERLKYLVKILCGAAKKCMKEKRMHLGPWRKHKYMQSKWL